MSNLKQQGTATYMYVQDYDETFPLALYFGNNGVSPCAILSYHEIIPYQKNADMEKCPSDPPRSTWMSPSQTSFPIRSARSPPN